MFAIEHAYSGALALVLGLIAVVDLRMWRIPDSLNLTLFTIGVLRECTVDNASVSWGIASAFVGFGLLWSIKAGYERLRGRTGLGLGDVKFVAASGPWVGMEGFPTMILYASTLGLVCVVIRHLVQGRTSLSDRLPFGPFLAIGLWLVWIHGPLMFSTSIVMW